MAEKKRSRFVDPYSEKGNKMYQNYSRDYDKMLLKLGEMYDKKMSQWEYINLYNTMNTTQTKQIEEGKIGGRTNIKDAIIRRQRWYLSGKQIKNLTKAAKLYDKKEAKKAKINNREANLLNFTKEDFQRIQNEEENLALTSFLSQYNEILKKTHPDSYERRRIIAVELFGSPE